MLADCNTLCTDFSSSGVQPSHSAVSDSFVAHSGETAEIWGQEIIQTFCLTWYCGLISKYEENFLLFFPVNCIW